jgi:hypothetical protein
MARAEAVKIFLLSSSISRRTSYWPSASAEAGSRTLPIHRPPKTGAFKL